MLESEQGQRSSASPALTTTLMGLATMADASISAPWGITKLPEYGSYSAMRSRCLSPTHHAYARYGGRGITICERWDSFAAFLEDMGPRPSPQHTIERRDNDGNYEPSNCYWATKAEQNGNRSICRMMPAFGETLSLSAWARKFGIGKELLHRRLADGLSLEDALRLPVREKRGGPSCAYRLARIEGGDAFQKARENLPQCRPVIAPDGKVWASATLAAEAYGRTQATVWAWCKRYQHGWRFA